MGYEGTYIYVLQYNFTFQYLFAWKNEVYRQEMFITPDWYSWRRWAWWMGYLATPYSKYQLERGEQIILSGAMKSIDLLKQVGTGEYRKRKAEVKRSIKNVMRTTASTGGKSSIWTKCQWQARADEEGKPILLCLTHGKVAPIDENPKHE
mgnify:CR=1 FL=1